MTAHPYAAHDIERKVLATSLRWPDYRGQYVDALVAPDFHNPAHRRLFVRVADLHRRGELIDRMMIEGRDVRRSWSGFTDEECAECEEILATSSQSYAPGMDVELLRVMTKRRALIAAAERVLIGEDVPDPVLEWLMSDLGAAR